MASERDMELLDEYLRNKLTGKDKTAFEEVLKNDSLLQKEMRVQQQVVNSLRQARAAELKQMLNNVPITAAPLETVGASMLGKVAAFLLVASLVGGGFYIYYSGDKELAETANINKPDLTPATTQTDAAPSTETIQPPVSPRDATADVVKEEESAPNSTKAAGKVDSIAPETRKVLAPTEETKATELPSTAASDSGKGIAGVMSTPSITIEPGINGNNGKFNFHYQFKDSKLFLYGVFDQNLYELIEFSGSSKRSLFLYYKDKFYLLNEDDSKVKRLAPVSDPALLKKLKDYRAVR